MKINRIKQKISDLKDSRDFYKCIVKEDLELLEQLEEAINFIQCSLQLKDEEVPTFKEWLKHFKSEDNYYWFDKETLYSEKEMLKIYDNLPNY